MKILRLRSYYYPENVSARHLSDDLDEAYLDRGIEQLIYTPLPTRGVTKEQRKHYRMKKREILNNGLTVVNRFSIFKEYRNPYLRMIRYILCNIIEYHKGIKAKDIDLVHAGSTPPTQGFISALVSKKLSKRYKKKVPFVYNLQDIFPDSLVNIGMTKKGSLIWKIGRKIENFTYNHADKIIVISDGFKKNIMEKGVPDSKIVVVSNWADLNAVNPVSRANNTLFDEYNIDRRNFIVLYAGNIGEAQGADVILDSAKQLKDNMDIQFVIFGGGARYPDLVSRAVTEKITNVFITSLQPQERVSEVYSMGNIALITCKPGTGNAGMPSKIWSIMACNTPIIASFDTSSDLADVIRESGAGCCIEPGNAKALADEVLKSYKVWKQGSVNNINIREYAIKIASKESCVQKYIDTLLKAVDESSRRK